MTPSPVRLWTALLTVYVVWGSTYLGIRYAVGADTGEVGLPPLLMAGVRFALAGALLYAWSVRRPAPDGRPDPLGLPQWRATAVVGGLLLLGGNGLVTVAEDRGVASGVAAVLVATVPLWVAGIGAVRRTERLSRAAVAGLTLGFVGVVILFDPLHADDGGGGLVGPLLVLLAATCWSVGSYWSKSAPLPRRPLVMTGMEMLCGGVALIVVSVATGDAAELRLGEVGPMAWAAWAYLVVFGSLVAFTAYVWLLQNARLSLVTTYAFVNPVVAVGLGALPPLREPLSARTLVATGVIVVGVGMIVLTRRDRVPAGNEAGPVVAPSPEQTAAVVAPPEQRRPEQRLACGSPDA